MKDLYKMVTPEVFKNNPLIKLISEDENWTVSNDKKIPINAKLYLKTGNFYNAHFRDGNPLVTLDELDEDKNLQAVNRTYRLKARENNIIMIDVEPNAPLKMRKEILKFPSHYTEVSTNGGVHLLIKVPNEMITDENRYMFEGLSVFKEKLDTDDRKAYYEVLFNDHFITFTKKMDTEKETINFYKDKKAWVQLENFLEMIKNDDEERKKQREIARQYKVKILNDIIDEEKEENVKRFIALRAFNSVKQRAEEKNVADFNNDYSRYEMSVASGVASHVLRIHDMCLGTRTQKELAKSLEDEGLIHAVYLIIEDVLHYREKHDETRDELPWLLFIAKNAYEYIKAQNSKE